MAKGVPRRILRGHPTSHAKGFVCRLAGGDRRTIGHADEVVRMRAAVQKKKRELLEPYKKQLLALMAEADQQELRWHLAAMVPRLVLTAKERQITASSLNTYLADRSSIVRTFALQGLADLAENDADMRAAVMELLREATRSGTAAMKARSRKLLLRLERL